MENNVIGDLTWLNELPRDVLDEVFRSIFEKVSPEKLKAIAAECEKEYGKSLGDIGLELSRSKELSQQERKEIYEIWKRYYA